jgi:hypothetical protein
MKFTLIFTVVSLPYLLTALLMVAQQTGLVEISNFGVVLPIVMLASVGYVPIIVLMYIIVKAKIKQKLKEKS